MRLAWPAATVAGLLVVAGGGCQSHHDCAGGCSSGSPVVFDLSCGGTDLTSEVLTGVCGPSPSSPDFGGSHQQYVYLRSEQPGDCHVELIFATGFTFSADVHFSSQTDNTDPQCPCGYIQPDQTMFTVNNPTSTCVDASPPEFPYPLAQGQKGPIGLAVDSTYAYWTDETGGFVMRVATGGSIPIQLAPQASPAGIAIDSAGVYWTDYTGPGEVVKLATGSATPITLATGQSYPASIAVAGSVAYWSNSANGAANMGSIVKLSVSGGTPITLASAQNFPNGIAVDAANVYWANYGSTATNGAIMKLPIGGGAPTTLAAGQSAPAWLAVDDKSVYWTNYGTGGSDGSVMRVALDGGTPVTLASAQAAPEGIAVDATSVYWLVGNPNTGNGSLLKLTPK